MSEVKFKPYEPVTDMEEIRSLVSIDACSEASSDDLFGIIQSSGCLVRGHFRLLSGNHSEYFLRYSQIRRSRRFHDVITNLLISQLQERSIEFDAILCPESAGQSIGVAIQHQLGEQDPLLIVAKVGDDKRPTDTINYHGVDAGTRVLIINDIVSTGEGLKRLISLTTKLQIQPVGIALFARRVGCPPLEEFAAMAGLAAQETVVLTHLLTPYWPEAKCKACAHSEPIVDGRHLN